jgi:D-alanine-D-alanine ligase
VIITIACVPTIAKWTPESVDYETPIWGFAYQPDDALRTQIHQVAMAAYHAIGVRDYGRVDMRVYDGVPDVLDVNANPDITRTGGMYRAAPDLGIEYGAFLRQLLEFAYVRKTRHKHTTTAPIRGAVVVCRLT